jgi:hypothetical protein
MGCEYRYRQHLAHFDVDPAAPESELMAKVDKSALPGTRTPCCCGFMAPAAARKISSTRARTYTSQS